MQMNIDEIKEILPHRDPFLLVDEIIEMELGKRIVGVKNIRQDEYWFKGHFPNYPVVPGVLIIEMLAQTGGVCVLAMPENKGKLAFLTGVEKARFKHQVKPGDKLVLEVEMVRMRSNYGVGNAVAKVNGDVAAQAEIRFVIADAQ